MLFTHTRKGTPLTALAVSALLSVSAPALAAPILGSAGSGLHTMSTPQENLARYWDGNSWDSTSTPDGGALNPCSAGSLALGMPCTLNDIATHVAGLSGVVGNTFSLAQGNAGFQAWGGASGDADMNFAFGNVAGGAWYDFDLLGEFTDDWAINEVGWYEMGNPANMHSLFSPMQVGGSVSSAFITGDFGFYYRNSADPTEVFFTQSALNGIGDKQQFAAFQYDGYTILGVEDIFSHTISPGWQAGTADYDYNDVMFGFRQASVPEPGTLLFFALGLAGVAARRLRKKG